VVQISKLLRSWFGGKVLVWDETEAVSSPGSTEEREWQAALAAAEEREWQAALVAAEEREWRAALVAAEEREWRALITGAHQKTAAVAPAVVIRKKQATAETDEQEWSTLLASAKAKATVMMVVPRKPDRERAWQTVFGKPRPGTGASAH
jgi:regulator of protease activity HflC (stomatin/prohibitin superfamily)